MWGDLLFAWGGLVVQPVVGVGVGVGDVVGFRVLGGVGIRRDGEGQDGAIRERTVADGRDGIGDGNRSQRSAAKETIIADFGHGIRDFEGREGSAAGKRMVDDFRDGGRNADARQRGTAGERRSADFGQRIGQGDGSKRRTAGKCARGKLSDGIGNNDGFQQIAVIEGISADGGDAVRDAVCPGFAGVGVEQKRAIRGAAQGIIRQEEIRVIRRRVKDCRALQPMKASSAIAATESGMSMVVRDLHRSNVPDSMAVRPLGRVIDVS